MAKAARKQGGRGGANNVGRGRQFLSLFIAIILVVLFFDSVIVLGVGMIPSGVAFLIDRTRRKHAARTVAWMNLAGCLVVILELWTGGGSIALALELLVEPLNWVIMFGAAAFGWVIYFPLPPIVAGYLTLSQEMKLKELAKKQKALEKEWGKDVRRSAPLDELETLEREIAEAERQAKRRTSAAPKAEGASGEDEDDLPDEDLSDTPAGRPLTGRQAGGAER